MEWPVISTRLVRDQLLIRCLGEAPPTEAFQAVEPNLEDVYFCAIKGLR